MSKRLAWITIALAVLALASLTGCLHGDGTNEPGGDDDDDLSAGDDDAGGDDDFTPGDDDDEERITLDLVEGCNPFSTSDACVLPYPSSFFQVEDPGTATGYRVNYPEDAVPVGEETEPVDVGPTNLADGCSPAGPILIHFGVDVNPDQLTRQRELDESLAANNPIALFNLDTGERVLFMSEMDQNRKEEYPGKYPLIIRPLEPMAMGARHVVVLTDALTDDTGLTFESPEAFAVLRDNVLTTNEEIEEVRDRYETIFDFLAGEGYAREHLLLAFDFVVASDEFLTGSVMSMRDEALNAAKDEGFGYVFDEIVADANANTALRIKGRFEVPHYLDENSDITYDDDHHPVRRAENAWYPFAMLIPKVAEEGEPLPLVVFGHGLFGSGQSYLTGWGFNQFSQIANDYGAILVATDWIGLSSGDLEIILENVISDFNRITLVTDRLQQSLVNNIVLTETTLGAMGEDPAIQVGDNDLIDPARVYYYGVSLGGIMGSSFVSISNRFTRGVLAVPGSVWFNMFPRSVHWNLIYPFADVVYPDPLSQQILLALVQTRFDHSDPVALTRRFVDPTPDMPAKRVLLQEAIGDSQVPNMATEMLARALGVNLLTPSIFDVEGLGTVTSPYEGSALAQIHLVEQEQANPPPEANIPPESDNGVHDGIIFLENSMAQLFTFMNDGTVEQYCDGACDPD